VKTFFESFPVKNVRQSVGVELTYDLVAVFGEVLLHVDISDLVNHRSTTVKIAGKFTGVNWRAA
jgi:hypothetical protein